MSGKGSKPRPIGISRKSFDARWAMTFEGLAMDKPQGPWSCFWCGADNNGTVDVCVRCLR